MTDHDEAALAARADENVLLKELDAALDVEPSRGFADGVRARVHRSHVRTMQMWWGLAAAATIGFAVVALWRPAHEQSVPAPVQVAAAPVQTPPPTVPATVTTSEPVAVLERPTPRIERNVTPVAELAANTTAEPRLEVITNQGDVLRQIWADVGGRALVAAEAEPAIDGLSLQPIEVSSIEVRPIVVSEIGKEPGRGGAAPVIRRVDATKETR